MESRCKFWLPKKKRFCANTRLGDSSFCGNHLPRSDGQWVPCPIDPSHSVLKENLEGHTKRCPFMKQVQTLTLQPFYQKGINAGVEEDRPEEDQPTKLSKVETLDRVASEFKRNAVYSMTVPEFYKLITKIESVHALICKDIRDSFKIPEACGIWIKREVDSKLPFQEKHVMQQASILGNLEEFGVLRNSGSFGDDDKVVPAVVEFGAGRGYLTQMLADCYGIGRVFLVERKSYKLKGVPYLAIGKHLCGPATDLTLRCCLMEHGNQNNVAQHCVNPNLRGLAIATCCHHLCQWKNYINKKYLLDLGITKEEFHAVTCFTSWAVDADHGSDLSDCSFHPQSIERKCGDDCEVEDIVRNMKAAERAVLGFMCKQIIDMGRLMWMKERGLQTQFVKYVPPTISPENHLLIAGCTNHL